MNIPKMKEIPSIMESLISNSQCFFPKEKIGYSPKTFAGSIHFHPFHSIVDSLISFFNIIFCKVTKKFNNLVSSFRAMSGNNRDSAPFFLKLLNKTCFILRLCS